jgi:hypothetical protein
MALFIRQNEERSELQRRLAAELQEKARTRAKSENELDDIEKSNYLQGTKRTTSLAWVWLLVVGMAVAAIILIMMRANGQI